MMPTLLYRLARKMLTRVVTQGRIAFAPPHRARIRAIFRTCLIVRHNPALPADESDEYEENRQTSSVEF